MKKQVLIADDSERLLEALKLQLERYGYEVVTCTDAYSALARAQSEKPDVMVLDVRMPAGNGFSVLERMSKQPELRNIPVIFVTGERDESLHVKACQLGAVGLIQKPISLAALLSLINQSSKRAEESRHEISDARASRTFNISEDTDFSTISGAR